MKGRASGVVECALLGGCQRAEREILCWMPSAVLEALRFDPHGCHGGGDRGSCWQPPPGWQGSVGAPDRAAPCPACSNGWQQPAEGQQGQKQSPEPLEEDLSSAGGGQPGERSHEKRLLWQRGEQGAQGPAVSPGSQGSTSSLGWTNVVTASRAREVTPPSPAQHSAHLNHSLGKP